MSNRWQMLMGYTYSQSRVEGLSVNVNPNTLINVTGPLAGQNTDFNGQIGDRPHQFKVTGTYVLPFYDIGLAGNLNSQSGAPITRQVTVAQTVGGNSTVNVEPLGSYRLPTAHRRRPAGVQDRALRQRASSRCRWTSTTSPTPTRRGTRAP